MITFDVETYSEIDLKYGPWRYAEHPSTKILCMAWQVDDYLVQLWLPGEPLPMWVRAELWRYGEIVEAHNAEFERAIWRKIMVPQFGAPDIPDEYWQCSAAKAAAHVLPRSLELACKVMRTDAQKDMAGKRTMKRLTKPIPNKKEPHILARHTPESDPKGFEVLYTYCMDDVRAEHALSTSLRDLTPTERQVWLLDQKINERGVRLDKAAIDGGLRIIRAYEKQCNAEVVQLTGGVLDGVTKLAQMQDWMATKGVQAESLDKASVQGLLRREDLPPEVRRVLEIRQSLAKTSTKKLKAMSDALCADGMVRSILMYCGAGPGRWAGKGIQLHNLPRRKVKDQEEKMQALARGDLTHIQETYDDPLDLISACLRGFIIPRPGKVIRAADYSAIEGRGLVWLADERRALRDFHLNDQGKGEEPYCLMASDIFGRKITKENNPDERDIGKVACIEAHELVLTERGLVPISKVGLSDRVWDGIEWVSHQGAICQGIKKVITYDGLTATEDHLVFTRCGRTLPFGDCARQQIPLAKTGVGRKEIRMGRNTYRRYPLAERGTKTRSAVPRVQEYEMDKLRQPSSREDEGLPKMFATSTHTRMALAPHVHRSKPVYQSKEQELGSLRRPGDRIPIRICSRSGGVGPAASGTTTRPGNRPHRQQRSLRTRESQIRKSLRTAQQHPRHSANRIPRSRHTQGTRFPSFSSSTPRSQVRRLHSAALTERALRRRDSKQMVRAFVQTKREVWDLLNAGPRHRFTVSNCLVHNCLQLGYQGGISAFETMARTVGIDLAKMAESVWPTITPEEKEKAEWVYEKFYLRRAKEPAPLDIAIPCDVIKQRWRRRHPNAVMMWKAQEEAAKKALATKRPVTCGRVTWGYLDHFLFCRLPSGRVLAYREPKLITPKKRDLVEIDDDLVAELESQPKLTYMSPDSQRGGRWSRTFTYGGKLVENITQAVARDIMAEAMLRVDKAGYDILFTVHDEVVSETEVDFGSTEEYVEILTQLPDWAKGFPLKAEGWSGERYRK